MGDRVEWDGGEKASGGHSGSDCFLKGKMTHLVLFLMHGEIVSLSRFLAFCA